MAGWSRSNRVASDRMESIASNMVDPISVVDLFAGPGGLGEGFSAFRNRSHDRAFRIRLSVEKDRNAHQTLELRSFFRQFEDGTVPDEYYRHIQNPTEFTRGQLFSQFQDEADTATRDAWNATLGETPEDLIDERLKQALRGAKLWALIGGPPCQAFSLVGRSRVGGIDAKDRRVYLYREYLRVLAKHAPPVFVMENVKGILSAKVEGKPIIDQILSDLEEPAAAISASKTSQPEYQIYSLVKPPQGGLLCPNQCFKPRISSLTNTRLIVG